MTCSDYGNKNSDPDKDQISECFQIDPLCIVLAQPIQNNSYTNHIFIMIEIMVTTKYEYAYIGYMYTGLGCLQGHR